MSRKATAALVSVIACVLLLAPIAARAQRQEKATALPGWVEVDYSELIDRRQLSHTGDSVGMLLARLDGRALDAARQDPAVFEAHSMLEPLLEPYAYVLPDAMDSLTPPGDGPLFEIGSLWRPGAGEPAWVELLRARRYLVESDGAGKLRLFLPLPATLADEVDSVAAAGEAYRAAWPVLRHVFAAERRRLAGGSTVAPTLKVRVHPYRHAPERSTFRLGTQPARFNVDSTLPDGFRPPLDLVALRRFLASGLLLEGARFEQDGSVRWLGSLTGGPPEVLGRPIDLADFAVAYRAVFYGGLTEPYMSLDRGYSPQTFIVNYGGRLRDTALGWVSLLADIRFKTFSQGIDIATGRDVREEVRRLLPEFGTHIEQMTWDPLSASVATQQTRLWFYPDDVDLTVSAQGDVLVLRKVRMSAASERLEGVQGTAAAEKPWTLATVDAINREYDTLQELFPELSDLNQAVRLLALFAWFQRAESEGRTIPDLDILLAQSLPALPTPRLFPQLLAFDATPPPGSRSPVEVIERLDVVEALDRLRPSTDRPLPASRRYARAVGSLDPGNEEQAALLRELGGGDPSRYDDSTLDLMTYRAERLLMHDRVLSTLAPDKREMLTARLRSGEDLRVFSIGIGGIDLGMGKVVARAQGRSMNLGSGGLGLGASAPARASDDRRSPETGAGGAERSGPREAWRRDPEGLPAIALPDHGLKQTRPAPGVLRQFDGNRVEFGPAGERKSRPQWLLVVYGEDEPELRSRRIFLDAEGRVSMIERLEAMRTVTFRIEVEGERLSATRVEPVAAPGVEAPSDSPGQVRLPRELATLRVAAEAVEGATEPPAVTLVLTASSGGATRSLQAGFPRPLLKRLVLGRAVDRTPDRPLSGFSPVPDALGGVETMMVLLGQAQRRPPWESGLPSVAGEEDPVRLARALESWWGAEEPQLRHAVVGVDPLRSAERWTAAPRPRTAMLLLPADGFPETRRGVPQTLRRAWGEGRIVSTLPETIDADLVVLVSAEAPGLFAARLRALAREPAMAGKLMAAWSLSGAVRQDLPATLLAEGNLAALGLAETTLAATRAAADRIAEFRASWEEEADPTPRIEQLSGPFLWYF